MDGAHHHRPTLKQRKGGAHCRLLVGVTHLHVGNAGKATSGINGEA